MVGVQVRCRRCGRWDTNDCRCEPIVVDGEILNPQWISGRYIYVPSGKRAEETKPMTRRERRKGRNR